MIQAGDVLHSFQTLHIYKIQDHLPLKKRDFP